MNNSSTTSISLTYHLLHTGIYVCICGVVWYYDDTFICILYGNVNVCPAACRPRQSIFTVLLPVSGLGNTVFSDNVVVATTS
jgi:hypothetical protein